MTLRSTVKELTVCWRVRSSIRYNTILQSWRWCLSKKSVFCTFWIKCRSCTFVYLLVLNDRLCRKNGKVCPRESITFSLAHCLNVTLYHCFKVILSKSSSSHNRIQLWPQLSLTFPSAANEIIGYMRPGKKAADFVKSWDFAQLHLNTLNLVNKTWIMCWHPDIFRFRLKLWSQYI